MRKWYKGDKITADRLNEMQGGVRLSISNAPTDAAGTYLIDTKNKRYLTFGGNNGTNNNSSSDSSNNPVSGGLANSSYRWRVGDEITAARLNATANSDRLQITNNIDGYTEGDYLIDTETKLPVITGNGTGRNLPCSHRKFMARTHGGGGNGTLPSDGRSGGQVL